jgi:hypothetical protein
MNTGRWRECVRRVPVCWRRRAGWLAGAFVLYSLVGLLVIPRVVKWQLLKQLPPITKRVAHVGQVRMNPWALSLTVRDLELTEPDGRRFFAWDEFYVNFQASSLFRWAWTFREVRLVSPFVEVLVDEDGRSNLANLFESDREAAPSEVGGRAFPRLGIFHLQITNGCVAFEDRARRTPFHAEHRPINLELPGFTTRPGSESPYAFEAEGSAGHGVSWSGSVSVDPLQSRGRLELRGLRLRHLQPYVEEMARLEVTGGELGLELRYEFGVGRDGLNLVVSDARVRLDGLEVQDSGVGEALLKLERVEVRDGALDLRAAEASVGLVEVFRPTVQTRLDGEGRFNWLELARQEDRPREEQPTSASAEGPGMSWTLRLERFDLQEGKVLFEDQGLGRGFRTELDSIRVEVEGLSTEKDSEAAYSYRMVTEAGEALTGAGSIALIPLRSAGEVTVGALELGKYLPYAEPYFGGRLAGGKLDAVVQYWFAHMTDGVSAGVSNAAVTITGLDVQGPDGAESVLQLRELGIEQVSVDVASRVGRAGRVGLDDGKLRVRREPDGRINLLDLIRDRPQPRAGDGVAADPLPRSAGEGGWTFGIDAVELRGFAVGIEDLVPPVAVLMLLDEVALSVEGVSTARDREIRTTLSTRVNEEGFASVRAGLTLEPLWMAADVGVTNLGLARFSPYLAEHARLGITNAVLELGGQVRYGGATEGAPRLRFIGNAALRDVRVLGAEGTEDLVGWEDLVVSGIDLRLAPDGLGLESVDWRGLKIQIAMDADGQLNLTKLRVGEAAGAGGAASVEPSASTVAGGAAGVGFPVRLERLRLERASVGYADRSIQPNAVFRIEELGGEVEGVSTEPGATTRITIEGRVAEGSPLSIHGRFQPLAIDRGLELAFTNRNVELAPLTPYMEKYGGHPLNRGRLSTELVYRVEEGRLTAENRFRIDQLTLGARNNSPDATALPVRLGVALLKDRNGRIELSIPVEGRLDDPQFRVGPVIGRTVMNLLVRAATSPFSLLGALVGGGEELSYVEFNVGTVEVPASERQKLDGLARALLQRPALNLEIQGEADPVRDGAALARGKLDQQIAQRQAESHGAEAQAERSVDAVGVEPAQREPWVRQLFVEQFGTNALAELQAELLGVESGGVTQSGEAASETAPRKRGWFKRLLAKGGLMKREDEPGSAGDPVPGMELNPVGLALMERMETELVELMTAGADDLSALADARARWVQEFLVVQGGVGTERLWVGAVKPGEKPTAGGNRVRMSLN